MCGLLCCFISPWTTIAIFPRLNVQWHRRFTATTAAAESLQNGTHLLKSSAAADSLRAELQVLLAEVKRLSLHQEHLKQDVAALDVLEPASRLPSKSANLRKNGCLIGPILTVPFGRRVTYGSSDWSEATADTPVRNVVSGDTLYPVYKWSLDSARRDFLCHLQFNAFQRTVQDTGAYYWCHGCLAKVKRQTQYTPISARFQSVLNPSLCYHQQIAQAL